MVILINPFIVFDGCEHEFLRLWDQTGAIFRHAEGYISARLCKALPKQVATQRPPFTHVNVAEWESAEHYGRALADPGIKSLAPAYAKVCTFDPALYEVWRDLQPG